MTASPPFGRPLVLELPDDAASDALGAALARLVTAGFATADDGDDGFTIHLAGDLGAGKTSVARALLRTLGVTGRVKSPTFALVEAYVVDLPKSVESRRNMKLDCYHFDFYRFENPRDWLDAGFRDYFADAALRLVEWPERAVSDGGSLLPAPDVALHLATASSGRIATLDARTPRGAAWLTASRIGADGAF